MPRGPAPEPVFVRRQTAAARCEISVDTFDLWVRDGFVPPPAFERGQTKRWYWPDIEMRLAHQGAATNDPFMQGVENADQTARRRRAS